MNFSVYFVGKYSKFGSGLESFYDKNVSALVVISRTRYSVVITRSKVLIEEHSI